MWNRLHWWATAIFMATVVGAFALFAVRPALPDAWSEPILWIGPRLMAFAFATMAVAWIARIMRLFRP